MIIDIFLVLMGLCIGSFLNVCIYRLPREESIIKPASHCPNCKSSISWYDNIPILSYLFLKGKCRRCGWRIPVRYPLVEALTAIALISYYHLWGLNLVMFSFFLFTAGLIVATFSDFETQTIPDQVSLGLIPVGLIFSYFNPILKDIYRGNPILNSLLGMIVGGGIIYLTGIVGKLMFKKEAMGFGDVKLLAMIGTFMGWKWIIFIYFLAPFFAISVALYKKIRYGQEYIPYGPYLAFATVFTLLFKDKIMKIFFY